MTARYLSVRTQAWKAKWAVFKTEGFVCKRFLPSFPSPSTLFYSLHFSRCNSLLPNPTETLATQATLSTENSSSVIVINYDVSQFPYLTSDKLCLICCPLEGTGETWRKNALWSGNECRF